MFKVSLNTQPVFIKTIHKNEKKHHLHCAHMCKNIYYRNTDVLMNKYKNTLYIAIEGTDTVVNWIDNISVAFKTDDIHRGFQRYANNCMTDYDFTIPFHDFDKVVLCGHSLGSAGATLIAYHLCKKAELNETLLPSNLELVVFGCPRIGGEQFHTEFNRLAAKNGMQIASYQNYGDIVCSIPFDFLGYRTTFDDDHIKIMETQIKPIWDLYNHYMISYVKGIENLLEKTKE